MATSHKAAVNAPHSRRFATKHDPQNARQRLECACLSTALKDVHQGKSNHCNQIKPLLLGLAFIWFESGILFSIRAFAPLREVSVPPNGILRKVAEASGRLRKAPPGEGIYFLCSSRAFANHRAPLPALPAPKNTQCSLRLCDKNLADQLTQSYPVFTRSKTD
jgi:hypothetical protein